MTFLRKHWLGIAVLVFAALAVVTVPELPRNDARLYDVLFALFLLAWVFRGFIRFCGRAWRHGVTKG